ncbi:hypothetical protein PUN28_000222 [Cardiocondyla obscurior]|uniref:Transposase n=1 Tax=Cardiocondyla obscurior TaxID=286306 RepID=A0AAW2GYS6_9HYME
MGKTRGVHETTPELRNRMVGMYEAGLGLREIAAAVNCSQRTVKRWLNRFDKEGTVETRERCGRKRATTSEQDEAIVRLATETPITAAKAVLPALGLTCSVDTVRERLHKAGIHNWSPSRKYMQRIPLGDADGAAIQQAVWRPTGTQLGKKKSSRDSGKPEKSIVTVKKKSPSKKIKSRETYSNDDVLSESLKQNQRTEERQQQQQQQQEQQQHQQQGFVFPQQNLPPLPSAPQVTEMQPSSQPVSTNQTEFSNALSLVQQPQPIYQHPGLSMVQNWPLDLVQGSHHYPQGQPNPIPHEHPPPQTQLQELHTQQEQQQHHAQQAQHVQTRLQDQSHQQNTQSHHHSIDQRLSVDHHIQQQHHQRLQSGISSPEHTSVNIGSDSSNTCSSNENSQSSCEPQQHKTSLRKSGERSERKKKKKGGKAKGTLETSVEIRNRMIGMSEAGLSTLSIALAIDRSERTVKRWLERWHKEGNVQTKERKGRRRITTKEQDEAIVAMATQHPLTAAKYVAPALGLKCSVDTIRERLHKAGIHSWKLGKKQSEGNAVHTVHLWQPSGNRPNKPKLPGEKKRKSGDKKRNQGNVNNSQKRVARKKKINEPPPPKATPPPANIIPEQSALPFHNPESMGSYASGPNIMQSVHNISGPPPALPQPPPPPPAPQPMQPMGPLMQQRPDCRLAPIVPPVSGPSNSGVAYPSCMVGGSSHASHMEQTDPLNYEPYIWSF